MSKNMELITSVTVGAGGLASVTLPATGTIPQTYTDLKILCSTKTNRGTFNNDAIFLNLNGSTSNITAKRLFGDGSNPGSNTGRGILNNAAVSTSVFSNTQIYIPNYTSANYKSISADSVTEINSTEAYTQLHAQLWSDTAAVTSIVLAVETGTLFLEGSTFYLYGISNVTSTTKATGGIVSSDGTYNYHMFPFSGTFTPTQNITADYIVVAGGGGSGGGNSFGGTSGGGAGGYRSFTAQSLTATAYAVTIGAGGAGGAAPVGGGTVGINGGDSIFNSATATGGGGGGVTNGLSGGSGGGGYGYPGGTYTGGAGNTPSTSPSQGNNGGNGASDNAVYTHSGGGGGAGQVGGNATTTRGGLGGNGIESSINGIPTYYAGGGGGGGASNVGTSNAAGGLGGGGAGKYLAGQVGDAGVANTGGGGGGSSGGGTVAGGKGGSGLVIIRYAI